MSDDIAPAQAKGRFCTACGAPNRATAAFCRGCGDALKPLKARSPAAADPPASDLGRDLSATANLASLPACPGCGLPLKAGAKYCNGCGAAAPDRSAVADPPAVTEAVAVEGDAVPLFTPPVWDRPRSAPSTRDHAPSSRALLLSLVAAVVALAAAGGALLWSKDFDFDSRPYAPFAQRRISSKVAWRAPDAATEDLRSCRDRTCFTAAMKKHGASSAAVRFSERMATFYGGDEMLAYAAAFTDHGAVDLVEVFAPGLGMSGLTEYLFVNGPSGLVEGSDLSQYEKIDLSQNRTFRQIRARRPDVILWPETTLARVDRLPDGGQRFVFDLALLDGCHACDLLGIAHFGQVFGADGSYRGLSLLDVTLSEQAAASFSAPRTEVIQLNDLNARSIWSTSVYSYAPGGGGPGGGAEDGRLRVGGDGDTYVALIMPPVVQQPVRGAYLELFALPDDGEPTPMRVELITQPWNWRPGDRLWWRDLPEAQDLYEDPTRPAPRGDWTRVDITQAYRAWQGGTPAYGIMLRPVSTNRNFNNFASTRAEDERLRPRLVLTR